MGESDWMILQAPKENRIFPSLREAGNESSKTKQLMRHEKDCGSPEVQIYQLTSRIAKLSVHLQAHKHDQATKRGLNIIIGKRMGLLRYLENRDRQKYLEVCATLGLKKLSAR